MKTRLLTVLLAAGVLLVAGLTAFSIPAERPVPDRHGAAAGRPDRPGHRRRPAGRLARRHQAARHDRRRAGHRAGARRARAPTPDRDDDHAGPAAHAGTARRPAAARPRDAPAAASASTREPRRRARSPPASLQPRMRVPEKTQGRRAQAAQRRRHSDPPQPRLHRRAARPLDRPRRPQLHHPQVPRAALPPADLPGRRHRVRHPLGGPGGHQRDRDRLRAQPERLLRRRARLDAVHALHLEDVRDRRQQGRAQGPVQPGRRDLRRRALPQGRRLRGRRAPRDLRLQPRRLVRRLRPPARAR